MRHRQRMHRLLAVLAAAAFVPLFAQGQATATPAGPSQIRDVPRRADPNGPLQAYIRRLRGRIDGAMGANPPTRNGTPLRGHAFVHVWLAETGALEGVRAISASSPEFAEYAVRLVSNLAPLEPLPSGGREMQLRIER